MQNSFHYWLPDELDHKFEDLKSAAFRGDLINRIWEKDASVWTDDGEDEWLGWLDIAEKEFEERQKYEAFADEVSSAGFESVVLLGMGGSSLCPEVLALTFGKQQFHILDSTVPAQIRALDSKLNIPKTLFIVASKSGSTLEPNTFKAYFYKRVCDEVGEENAGSHFVAITDPGSKLEEVAMRENFRAVFYGEPTVGGRFSALSVFGMTPAAAMGIDVESFLGKAIQAVSEARESADHNTAAMLGLIMGLCHREGRDKLTIFTSPEIFDLGAWMEQLIAESTGKEGVSIVPVDLEPLQPGESYGNDRLFAFLTMEGDERFEREKLELSDENQPYVAVELPSVETLGQEFFRWEFATAVAGSLMEINPFNQPDVESAKIEARKLTDAYEKSGELPADNPFLVSGEFAFHGDKELDGRIGQKTDPETLTVLREHFRRIRKRDYFAILAYIEMNDSTRELLQEIRSLILGKYGVATSVGFGPRFLHSTGQAYKGGAANGVFLQITSDDANDLDVPESNYSFGVVKAAQSRGDFEVLVDRGRRALRVHMGSDVTKGLRGLVDLIQEALETESRAETS